MCERLNVVTVWIMWTHKGTRLPSVCLLCVPVVRETLAATASWRITSQSLTSTSSSRTRWTKPSSLWSRRQEVSRADTDACCWNPPTLSTSTTSSHKVRLLSDATSNTRLMLHHYPSLSLINNPYIYLNVELVTFPQTVTRCVLRRLSFISCDHV